MKQARTAANRPEPLKPLEELKAMSKEQLDKFTEPLELTQTVKQQYFYYLQGYTYLKLRDMLKKPTDQSAQAQGYVYRNVGLPIDVKLRSPKPGKDSEKGHRTIQREHTRKKLTNNNELTLFNNDVVKSQHNKKTSNNQKLHIIGMEAEPIKFSKLTFEGINFHFNGQDIKDVYVSNGVIKVGK